MYNFVRTGLLAVGVTSAVVLIRVLLVAPGSPSEADISLILENARTYDVLVRRDTQGIPHIYGDRNVDVAFGMGYAHSEDDYRTIEEIAIAGRGMLASVKGKDAAEADYLLHLFKIPERIDSLYDSAIPEYIRAILQAYADGVNYYAARHPDKVTPGLLPIDPQDMYASFLFRVPFFFGIDKQLSELFQDTRQREISEELTSAFLFTKDTKPPIGSNAWALAPSRTSDGKTRLVLNSHQPYSGPVSWYEARLKSKQGWDVAGAFFPGSPFMLNGYNPYLGWANTLNDPDLIDIYSLTINPDNERQYLFDGEWLAFDASTASIKVRLWGPFYWTFEKEVLHTIHGPVMDTDHGVYAIRYSGMDKFNLFEQIFRLNTATSMDEFTDAMRMGELSSVNYIYADKDHNIALFYNALIPERQPGFDWQEYLPGDRSDLVWTDYLPFDELPHVINPSAGYVYNANNTPFKATAEADNLNPGDFAPEMGIETSMTNRAYRIFELFDPDKDISLQELKDYKYDTSFSDKSSMAELIREILALDPALLPDLDAAQRILSNWDMSADRENRSTALAILIYEPYENPGFGNPKPDLLSVLSDAIKTLKTHYGRLDPEWGQVNRIRRGDLDLAVDGSPDVMRAVYSELQDDGRLVGTAGDTFIAFVEWDEDGNVSSESIHQFGSATLDETSIHFSDQLPLFVEEKLTPVLFRKEDLLEHLESSYHLGKKETPSQWRSE